MKHICTLAGLVFLVFSCKAQKSVSTIGKNPNVLFILADDLGINALNCYGNTLVESPNIDRLFNTGAHFTNGYSNDPTCAPSRASIMSGQYVPRHGIYRVADRYKNDQKTLSAMKFLPPENHTVKGSGVGLGLEKTTMAEAFKYNGYTTAAYGKWHLGKKELGITHQGFDEGFEMTGHYNFKMFPHQEDVDSSLYSADVSTAKTIAFMEKAVANHTPFFAYVPYYLVHKPLDPKKEYLTYFKNKLKGNVEVGAAEIKVLAMIKSLDDSVGELIKALSELGIEEETLIVFTSDNGHYKTESNIFNQPYQGVKGQTLEGGIRVPYIFRWKGHIEKQSVFAPIIHVDLYPTLLGLTHNELPKDYILDGEDLTPLILGETNKTKRDALVWEYTNYANYNVKRKQFASSWVNVIQMDGYKLTEDIENGSFCMYNLNDDPYETIDVYAEYPEAVLRLKAKLEEWKLRTGYEEPVANPSFK